MESGLLTLYSDVKSEPVNWLWYPYIAIGKITLLQGDPGDGKSTMMMNLIAEISKGGATPDGVAMGRPHRVIYQCSEDGLGDTIKPRLEASGADCRNRCSHKGRSMYMQPQKEFQAELHTRQSLEDTKESPLQHQLPPHYFEYNL